MLKPHYFTNGVVSLRVGFPRSHRVTDGIARCTLCKMDLAIGRRGLTTLPEHWKSADHQLREIKFHLQLGMPLVIKNCVQASRRDQKRQREKVIGSADVHLGSVYVLSVNDLLDADVELEQASGESETVTQSRADKLWICQFIGGLVNGIGFHCLMRSVESLTANFVRVRQLQEYELARVIICLMELVVRNGVILVRQDVLGLLQHWRNQALPLKIVAQCKFLQHCGNIFSTRSEQAAEQFYVTARKAIRAVVRQIWRQ